MRELDNRYSKRKRMVASLSDNLKDRHKRRSFPIRMGDSVRIVRGDFTGIEGKVTRIDAKRGKVYVEGVTREKASGGSAMVPVHSSKIVITNLNLSDKWRSDTLATSEPAQNQGTPETKGEK